MKTKMMLKDKILVVFEDNEMMGVFRVLKNFDMDKEVPAMEPYQVVNWLDSEGYIEPLYYDLMTFQPLVSKGSYIHVTELQS